MDTFVVRIRPSGPRERGIRGVVDDIATGGRSAFRSAEELIELLSAARTTDVSDHHHGNEIGT